MKQPEQFRGWLLDLYLNQQEGLTLWFISEDDDQRKCFRQTFPATFYAAGPKEQLRALWKHLSAQTGLISLNRLQKKDVFLSEPVDVIEITANSPNDQMRLFHESERIFPDLTYYDADVTISARYMARYDAFPLAKCEITADENNVIQSIQTLSSRWDCMPELPPLRVLELFPDSDPYRGKVNFLSIRSDRFQQSIPLDSNGNFLRAIDQIVREYNPDILVTDWGDSWLIPFLTAQAKEKDIPLQLNRDDTRPVRWQKETTYFSYGHVVFRPEEAHLFGRCHVDRKAAMMWSDYNLAGTLEMARVTTLPIEKAARVSPGQGISTMQVITALEKDVLVPYQKKQVEEFKSGMKLIQSDRGGMVYQPKVGLHTDVAQIDFVSMYPAIIIKGNISPEVPLPNVLEPFTEELGIVPLTLKPLYEKRVSLKQKEREYPPIHPLVKVLKARSMALKWLLVVCFGFLGYKNARYGRIEAHEAVTKGGREVLLRAKEVAEEAGFEVLHMYVDALWIKKSGCTRAEHFTEVIDRINQRTGLTINLDGIYRWVAFLPSKNDTRIPIANRYFGVFQSGEIKVRGLEARRRDTPHWIANIQNQMMSLMAEATNQSTLQKCLEKTFLFYKESLLLLKSRQIPVEQLVVNGKVSYALEAYKATTPSVRAAKQMAESGLSIRPGMRIRYLYTLGDPDVLAWDLGRPIDVKDLNIAKYVELLAKAAASVFQPFGVSAGLFIEWSLSDSFQEYLLF